MADLVTNEKEPLPTSFYASIEKPHLDHVEIKVKQPYEPLLMNEYTKSMCKEQ
ncbi:hypothetical protein ANO11243_091770 [Dothideomycetidae sp. 11243]|nr:hypothetical protein ANO11243_091770 [fungal sp. No.11243]